MIQRLLALRIEELLKKSRKSILLLGPRQTGKSTLVKALKPDISIQLSREKEYREHLSDPEMIERITSPLSKNSVVSIDEIQRLPDMLNTLQAIIDERKDLIFLLTGSSARKLKHGSANLLPGRIFLLNLYPLTAREIGPNFDLEKALTVGLLPEIYLSENGHDLLESYAGIYLKEEIMAEALARNYASFSHFLSLAAQLSWQELNYSKISSDSEIPKETLRRYVEILHDTLIIHRVPGFTYVQSHRKAVQKEKILFFDLGVRNAILNINRNKLQPEELGHLFEQFIVLELIAMNSYYKKNWKIYYYRDQRQTEVDIIIETADTLIAVEVKFAKSYKSKFREPLDEFAQSSSIKGKDLKKIVTYRGEHSQKDKDVFIFPYLHFFEMMNPTQNSMLHFMK